MVQHPEWKKDGGVIKVREAIASGESPCKKTECSIILGKDVNIIATISAKS
jgi:hypothetical protein